MNHRFYLEDMLAESTSPAVPGGPPSTVSDSRDAEWAKDTGLRATSSRFAPRPGPCEAPVEGDLF